MAKRSKNGSMTEDYLQRIEWENKNWGIKGHTPWENAPDWKYHPFYAGSKGKTHLVAIIAWLALTIPAIGYLVISILVTHDAGTIFLSILFLFILMIFYWMSRPSKKKK